MAERRGDLARLPVIDQLPRDLAVSGRHASSMSRLRSRAGLVATIEERLEPPGAPTPEAEDPRARRIDDDPALPPSKMNRADGQDAVLERAFLVELEVPLVERLERF